MIQDVHYHQPCPVCGRSLRVGVTLLGRRVYCQHCGGGFIASDPALGETTDRKAAVRDAAVDRLLEQAALVLEQTAR
jgi:hypothetical protein